MGELRRVVRERAGNRTGRRMYAHLPRYLRYFTLRFLLAKDLYLTFRDAPTQEGQVGSSLCEEC